MSQELVIIVGSGPGVSAAVAADFARKGHPLLLIARTESKLKEQAEPLAALGVQVEWKIADASKPGDVARVISEVKAPIAALVYNAAGWGGPLLQAKEEELRAATEVNLYTIISATQAALEGLKQAHGVVLITGGGFALYPSSQFGSLSVGKAMTRSTAFLLAEELKPAGIRVHTVTIAGTVDPTTDFAPAKISRSYMELFENPDSPIEVVFQG